MQISQALNPVSTFSSTHNTLPTLDDVLGPEMLSQYLAVTDTVKRSKRRLPMDMMVRCVVCIAFSLIA